MKPPGRQTSVCAAAVPPARREPPVRCPVVSSFLRCEAENHAALREGDGVALPSSRKTWGKLLTPPAEALRSHVEEASASAS